MGVGFPFGSAKRSAGKSSSGRRVRIGAALLPGDPNPARFRVEAVEQFGPFVVATIVWPDAGNFEGRKIAVYEASPGDVLGATRIDPHFQEKLGPLAPIARFEPTLAGMRCARACARYLERTPALWNRGFRQGVANG